MTSQPIISKTWFTVAIIAIGLFLVWVIFRGCAPDNVHAGNKAAVDSTVKALNEQHKIDSVVKAEYAQANKVLAEQTVKQKEKIAVLEIQLNASGKRANKLAYSVTVAKVEHDTVAFVASCDSLVNAVADLTNILDNYEAEYKGLVQGYDFQISFKDSIINIQAGEIRRSMNAVNEIGGKYDVLYADYSKVVKQNKRGRRLNRVLAVGLLITGGILLSK